MIFAVPDATVVPLYNWILVELEYTVVPLITALKLPAFTHPEADPEPFSFHEIFE